MKKKILVLASTLLILLVLPACGEKEPSLYEQALAESSNNETKLSKSESSQELFEWLGYEDFEIKRELNKKDRATAKIINHSSYTLEGHIALVVYDENNAILDTQYVSLPKVGLKPNETFVADEAIHKENYYTVKFGDANMLRQK